MAHVNFPSDIQSISGRLCKREGIIYCVNRQTGKTTRTDRHSHTDANTEAQQTVRKLFASKAKFGTAWWKANKPSEANPKGSDNYQLVMKAYKSQHKIGNPLNYLRSLVNDDLKIKLGDLDITGEIKADAGTTEGGASGNPGGEG